jgi:S1-C subfamily serine protease
VNSEGNILTNEHVIDGCSSIQIRSNNGHHRAIVVASDQTNDLAIIQSEVGGLVPLPFRDGPGIRAGDGIILVGFPYSGILTSSPNVSIGAVSALAGIGDDTRFLQISAPVQPGNSGGPLLDSSGDVVGVVVATMNALAVLKITGSVPQNVNFAIKGSLAREFLDARRISYVTALPAAKMDTADVGEKGSRSTVLIECYQ